MGVEAVGGAEAEHYWSQWRGPLGTGVAPFANPPIEWGEKQNIRWKIPLPGKGHSTPIIWDDRVFITTATPFGEVLNPTYSSFPGAHDEVPIVQHHKFTVMGIDRRTGKILWEKTVREALPHAGGHYTASLASHSVVTDGERLFASFGSYGVYCLSLDGELLWESDLGRMHTLHGHGEGSSPALYGDVLIINWDHEGRSFLVAFDKRTGKERWKVERDGVTSWTTPIVVEQESGPQVIISGSDKMRAYDLENGEAIWECGGLSVENVVASPVAGDGMVYAGSSYDKQAVLAIRLDGARGDITGTAHVVWSRTRGAPYVPSPLLYGDSLYFLRHYQGILTRVNARTGEDRPGPLRLKGIRHVFASPVGAADRVYITDRDGVTIVISHDDNPEILALNRLDDHFSASAAVADRELFLRGEKFLYCIAESGAD
jgi:outer membrane protein assembly factor BamB